MDRVLVSERVEKRHPECNITKQDARDAFANIVKSVSRVEKDPREYIAIGIDRYGRMIELVFKLNDNGDWLIYHAITPPQKNAKRELGIQ